MSLRNLTTLSLALLMAFTATAAETSKPKPPAKPAATPSTAGFVVTSIALPGAPSVGVALDYLAIDRARHRVWVPAGGTGNAVVIDTKTNESKTVGSLPTKEVERSGQKRMVGPSSATVGDGVVYVGNRADSSVCAFDAQTLERRDCVTLPGSPDGVAYVARTKEVWVTTPRDDSIVILDVSTPGSPKVAGGFKVEGFPEGYAVDEGHGVFFTNLEDKDRTLRIDIATRKVTAAWLPSCGEEGPRGLAIDPGGAWLMVACTDHAVVLAASDDGHIVSKLDTGEGVDNIDYLKGSHALFVAASKAGTLTVAHLDDQGTLQRAAVVATAKGARNAVASDDGTAYVANGHDGNIVVVRAVHGW
jgi:DNA-binding beta-propeller fold protein YncE